MCIFRHNCDVFPLNGTWQLCSVSLNKRPDVSVFSEYVSKGLYEEVGVLLELLLL